MGDAQARDGGRASESSEWPMRPLGELIVSFDSLRAPVKEADRKPGPFPYYGASGIVDHVDGHIFDGRFLLIAEDGENLKTRQTPIAFLAEGKFWVNNHAHVVRGNEFNDTRYLMYAIRCADVSSYLTGSTMPKLTQGNLNRIPVVAPPLAEQQRIGQLLGSLDDKIELNRRMSDTLEAMARALFKSWFVDFDPVRAKAEGRAPSGTDAGTAALFPGEMVESELGMVPTAWGVVPLEAVMELKRGYDLPTAQRRPGSVPIVSSSGISGTHDSAMVGAPGVVTGRYGTVGEVFLIREAFWPLNTALYIRDFRGSDVMYAYHLLSLLDFTKFSDKGAVPGVNRNDLHREQVVRPPAALQRAFGRAAGGWLGEAARRSQESAALRRTRDTLLPRLLSGKLSVANAELAASALP